ncbi:hypothetical protein DY000_02049284 [Brassica cretica]|uniref:Uncharacterized protein n=1 Tax=Brassica cretica TaxID=69181 RepID=A0ABQ7ES87_BRACR|nr:hypothetical protein DY000_02049284 [Brassica cretica]
MSFVYFPSKGETEEEPSTRLAKNLEDLIIKEGPETIGDFIAKPVMGAGGVIPPPATYFEKIQAVVKKYDILFIADERNIPEHVARVAPWFQDGLKAFAKISPIIGELIDIYGKPLKATEERVKELKAQ